MVGGGGGKRVIGDVMLFEVFVACDAINGGMPRRLADKQRILLYKDLRDIDGVTGL